MIDSIPRGATLDSFPESRQRSESAHGQEAEALLILLKVLLKTPLQAIQKMRRAERDEETEAKFPKLRKGETACPLFPIFPEASRA